MAFPGVVTMERLGGLGALRRAVAITRPFGGLSAWIAVLHFAVRHVGAWFVWLSLAHFAAVPFGQMIDTTMDSAVHDAALLLISSAAVVSWTFTFTMAAVLYLAGRQAEGVTIEAIGGPPAPEPSAP